MVKRYIRDDIQPYTHYHRKPDPTTFMITFEVTKIYGNIPHELEKKALLFCINKCTWNFTPNRKFITDIIELTLNYNSFQFDKINDIQTQETAMGEKAPPRYLKLLIGASIWNHSKKKQHQF